MEARVDEYTDLMWSKVCEKVRKSVVFIDDESAESLHWAGGTSRLLTAGVTDFKQLSSFESGQPNQKKAVFITSNYLFDTTTNIIRDILQSSSFQYVICITNVSADLHLWKKTGSLEGDARDVFDQFEEKLLEWMGDMNFTAEVLHIAHGVAALTSNLLVVPAQSQLFPFLPHEYKKLEMKQNVNKATKPKTEKKVIESLADIDSTMLPESSMDSIKQLVCSLNALFDLMKVGDEVYSIGHTSRMIACELANYSPARQRRKTATKKASIIFIDRTLDVASVCGNHGDTLGDRIMNVLPRLQRHHNDVAINMVDICDVHPCNADMILPGCLAPATDDLNSLLLTQLLAHKQKEFSMELNRQLVQSATSEGLPVKLSGKPGRITADQLKQHLLLFKGHQQSIYKHAGLLQLAQCAIQTLKHPTFKSMETLHGLEKMLMLTEANNDSSIAGELTKILDRVGTDREFSLDQFMSLLVYLHSLHGELIYETSIEERQLQQKLSKTILDQSESSLSPLMTSLVGGTVTKNSVKHAMGDIFGKLRAIGRTREHLKKYRDLQHNPPGLPPTFTPLIKQILEQILDPAKPEMVDVEYRSSGLKDYLKSGFGYFMNVSKPRPSDCPIIIIFVIGGVSCNEARIVREMALKSGSQILLGGTRLVNHAAVLQSIFLQDRVQ